MHKQLIIGLKIPKKEYGNLQDLSKICHATVTRLQSEYLLDDTYNSMYSSREAF